MPLIGTITGSHTRLTSGAAFLVAGPNITISTSSVGSVVISSSLAATAPGGSNTEVQFNSAGAFGSDNTFNFDTTTKTVNFASGSSFQMTLTSGSAYHISASFGVYSPVFHSGIQTLTDAASITWDLSKGGFAQVTIAGARALAAPTNMRVGGFYTLIVKQDAVGGRTLSYATTYKFPYSTVPIITTGSNSVDILSFVSDGTNMYGSYVQSFG
jgi:hypothetical protein